MKTLAFILAALVSMSGFTQAETKEELDKRMAWFREPRFGMFIHWGLYSVPAGEWKGEKIKNLYAWLRQKNPKRIINNRVDKGRKGMEGMNKDSKFAGDYGTPEQQIPANGLPGVDWESCMTMNGTWGFFQTRREMEIRGNPASKPHRHRIQGRQLPAQRRPHRGR